MRKYVTNEELELLATAFIREFSNVLKLSEMSCVDIESFATEFLGLHIVYESFAEDAGKVGYISDGKRYMQVVREGMKVKVRFPADTIVIEKSLLSQGEWDRKRFTIAHEAAHRIMEKHFSMERQAAFHTDFDPEMKYTDRMLSELFDSNESITNRLAACLLMPDYLVKKVLEKCNAGKPVTVYDGNVLSARGKTLVRKMADLMGVSFLAFFNRLKELKLLKVRPISEYILKEYYRGGERGVCND